MADFGLLQGGGPTSQSLQSVLGGYETGRAMRQRDEAEAEQQRIDATSQKLSRLMQDPDFQIESSPQFAQLLQKDPELANRYLKRSGLMDQRRMQEYTMELGRVRDAAAMGDFAGAEEMLSERIERLTEQGRNPADSIRALNILEEQGPEAFVMGVDNMMKRRTGADQRGIVSNNDGKPAGLREHEALVELAGSDNEMVSEAAKISLGLSPRAGSLSAEQRTALDERLMEKVLELEESSARASETGKQQAQLLLAPKVRKALKVAEEEGKSLGEAQTSLARARAALPGLREVTNKLGTLIDTATYTTAGRLRDGIFRELGFKAPEGATARAQIEATLDNTVLPLLRDTFGAAFTQTEGDRLRATLMDPNESPSEKRARLNAFIENKIRQIETGEQTVEGLGGNANPQNKENGQQGKQPKGMTDQEADQILQELGDQ